MVDMMLWVESLHPAVWASWAPDRLVGEGGKNFEVMQWSLLQSHVLIFVVIIISLMFVINVCILFILKS